MEIKQIEKHAKTYGVPIIRTESHMLLADLVKKYNPKHILEIGTAVGYSGITMLENSDANLITIEHNKELSKLAKKNFKSHNLLSRVKIINDDCLVFLAKLISNNKFSNYFDLIFLDGPKAQYELMLESLVELLAYDGILIADNVLFRGYVEGQTKAPTKRYKTIIKRLNTFIENCKNHSKLVNFKIINTEDGIIFAQKVKNEK